MNPKRIETLSEAEIEDLLLVSPVSGDSPTVEDCVICLEPLNGPVVQLPCSHHYHRNCFSNWGRLSAVCPMCREEVSKH